VDFDASKNSASVRAFREHQVLVSDIVRLIEPNRLTTVGKLQVYGARWWEFLFGEPREAGVEGGVFPAIWGTIVMTLIMSLVVMPFGVLAALYMREYAKGGWLLSAIRISINNLAGVPSIVYGVFGLSFFCYTIGGYIDGGPAKAGFTPWPEAAWFSALAFLAIVGLAAFAVSFLSGRSSRTGARWRSILAAVSGLLWLATLVGIVVLLVKTPIFHGLYEARLPNPTFGKGCLLWAACTLALLTLPVVIVATEEALAAVPNSLREGSYACGAGKWQTIERIVLPYARPGIITGFILAMARGAGEVAPMMLVGAIPLTSDLPLDLEFPFLHGSRSFMHLGFQIYALGFQSQNSEAAKPMVFTATLLLLTIVTLLNLTAIWLRARLRKRFQSSQF
jgi:phosphate transport system permease protein